MRILILTENTGGGHNACAKSIKDYFESQSPMNMAIISSAMVFSSRKLGKAISDLQIFAYRFVPGAVKIFFSLYSKASSSSILSEGSVSYETLTAGSEDLYQFVINNNFDAIICCHVLGALMVSRIKKEHTDFSPITSFIATDCENDLTGTEKNLDWYFIPNEKLSGAFERMGIAKEKIIGSGIPVRPMFFETVLKEDAKRSLGIDPSHKHLLVMGGSMGAGAIEDEVLKIASFDVSPDKEVTVICGSNKVMYNKLSKICRKKKNFHILGFVQNISLYMDSADLYMTKPGGLSTSEAAVKHLPMILVDTVGGCETSNLYFYTSIGLAKTAKHQKKIAEYCLQLLDDEATLNEMSASIKKSKEEMNSSKIIFEIIENSIQQGLTKK